MRQLLRNDDLLGHGDRVWLGWEPAKGLGIGPRRNQLLRRSVPQCRSTAAEARRGNGRKSLGEESTPRKVIARIRWCWGMVKNEPVQRNRVD